MARKRGLSPDDVVSAARALADERGLEQVTLAAVAARLSVRSPSLYAHIDGIEDLRRRLALGAAAALRSVFQQAVRGREGTEALRAVAHAYRSFADQHPGHYAAVQRAVAPGEDDELYGALRSVLEPVLESLVQAGVREPDLIHVTRGFRSALHGFVELERGRGFGIPESIDESFERLVALILSGVEGVARDGAGG